MVSNTDYFDFFFSTFVWKLTLVINCEDLSIPTDEHLASCVYAGTQKKKVLPGADMQHLFPDNLVFPFPL